jgi:hypothetical protein
MNRYKRPMPALPSPSRRKRNCQCGCKLPVTGQALFATDACRKRHQRDLDRREPKVAKRRRLKPVKPSKSRAKKGVKK